MSDSRKEIAAATRTKAAIFLDGFPVAIDLKVAECRDYSALLRGDHEQASPLDDLLEWAARRGRVIISGRGASGKSALLNRLAIRAADREIAPFLIRLSEWNQAATEDWKEVRAHARGAMDFLLSRFGASEHDMTDAEFLPLSVQKLFLLDGVNETPGSVADEIIEVCDKIASMIVGAAVILTDRLVRRNIGSEAKWRFAMPMPVDNDEVERLIAGKDIPAAMHPLLRSPFFLDRAIQGELRNSPLSTIRELIETRGKLGVHELSVAADAAYRAYEIDRSRTFARTRFADDGQGDIAGTLLAGGILTAVGDARVAFAHHWYHDYLASKHVADNPELWSSLNRHSSLDSLTLGANSFDAIAFTLELLPFERRGAFLQAVYDWNPYAAGYALAEANIKVDDVPRDVRIIILAMLAEKRFDRHFYSARRANDALEVLYDDDAARFRAASSLEAVLAVVAPIERLSEMFATWQGFFVERPSQHASDELISALSDENSIIGWTAANVLKRLHLDDKQAEDIRVAGSDRRAVVRWRAVHVMGGFAKPGFVDELLTRLDSDEDENVRYGALRSLVEISSRDREFLLRVVGELLKRLNEIARSPKVLGELSRAVFLSRGYVPNDWSQEISKLFYGLLDRAEDPLEAQQWSKLASQLRVHDRAGLAS